MSEVPSELKYTITHEWVRLEKDGTVTVGITQHAQAQLGDIVFVEVPEVGQKVIAKQDTAVVESVKAAADIYAPISGTIEAVNPVVAETPEEVNLDAYGLGWLFKVKPDSLEDLGLLIDSQAYEAMTHADAES